MDLKKVWAERLRQYQLLIAFAAKQNRQLHKKSKAGMGAGQYMMSGS